MVETMPQLMVYDLTHEQIVRIWTFTTDFEQFLEVVKLA